MGCPTTQACNLTVYTTLNFCTEFGSNTYKPLKYTLQIQGFSTPNALLMGKYLMAVFVRVFAQKVTVNICPIKLFVRCDPIVDLHHMQ